MANAGRSEWWQQPDSLGGSSEGTEAVANSVSRNVETGRERQWKVRKGHQGEGISDNVACGSEAAESKNVAYSTTSGSQASPEERLEQERSEEAIAVDTCSGTFRPEGNWTVEPNVGRVVNGVPNRIQRIKALGNAVVPQLTYVIGMSIIKAMQDD